MYFLKMCVYTILFILYLKLIFFSSVKKINKIDFKIDDNMCIRLIVQNNYILYIYFFFRNF